MTGAHGLLAGCVAVLLHPVAWEPKLRTRAGRGAIMGVSDRMANDGRLYEEWGKEGLQVLNTTSTLLSGGMEKGLTRYDVVLMVAQRAKSNALQTSEESEGYPGPMGGMGARPQPVKSEVVLAIEQLEKELRETGELPELEAFDDEEPYGYRAEPSQGMPRGAPKPQKVTTFRADTTKISDEDEALVGGDEPIVTDAVVPEDVLIDDSSQVTLDDNPTALVEEDFDDVVNSADDELVGQLKEIVGKALDDGAPPEDESESPDEELGDELFAELFGGVMSGSDGGSIESDGMHPGDRG
mmetsp:Transcript_46927/g.116203  ORF Transcript_46927/g.116203 Transcript_46927/m.116203 type:complete len:297 (-) Transcript_46927:200-1090(-)